VKARFTLALLTFAMLALVPSVSAQADPTPPTHSIVQLVGYGPSLADERHYFLARSFKSAAERERQLSAFYGRDEWRQSYESTVMGLIETYHVVVVPLATTTVHEALAATPLSAPRATP
jgi:hypothetical protein